MIRAIINHRVCELAEGISILDAARSVDIEIPTLCHDPRLKPIGSCRMCLIEIESRPHPQTSCNTILADGMVIATQTAYAKDHEIDLICMGASGEGFSMDKLFGSTVDRILRHAPCPVLVARPVAAASSTAKAA